MDKTHKLLLRVFNSLADGEKQAVVNGLKTGTFSNVPENIVRVFSTYLRAARVSDASLSSESKR